MENFFFRIRLQVGHPIMQYVNIIVRTIFNVMYCQQHCILLLDTRKVEEVITKINAQYIEKNYHLNYVVNESLIWKNIYSRWRQMMQVEIFFIRILSREGIVYPTHRINQNYSRPTNCIRFRFGFCIKMNKYYFQYLLRNVL